MTAGAQDTAPQFESGSLPAPVVERLEAIAKHEESVLAILPMLEFSSYGADWLDIEESGAILAALERTLEHPYAIAVARNLRLQNAANQLNREAYDALLSDAGYVENWSFIGPFANDGMSGMHVAYGPESDGYDPGSEYDGKRQPVSWRSYPGLPTAGYVQLEEYLSPADSAVVYAVSVVDSPRSQRTIINAAVDGAYKLWVNGELVADIQDNLGGYLLRDEIDVRLRRGPNVIALKIGTADYGAGFHLRILNQDREVVSLTDRVPEAPLSAAFAGQELDGGSGVRHPQAWLRTLTEDVDVAPGERDVMAAKINELLAPEAPDQPWLRWLDSVDANDLSDADLKRYISIFDKRWRREALLDEHVGDDAELDLLVYATSTRAQAPGDAGLVALRDGLERLESRFANDPRVRALRIELLSRTGYRETAWTEAASLVGAFPTAERALRIASGYAGDAGRAHAESGLLATLARQNPMSLGTVDAAVRSLREAARGEDAAQLLVDLEPFFAHSITYLSMRARWARADERYAEAESWLRQAISLDAHAASLHERLAQVQLANRELAGAAESLRSVLLYSPQNASARRLLRHLEEEQDAFYEEWRMPMDEIAEMRADADDDRLDYRSLVDQKFTRVYDSGLAKAYVQRAWQVYSREGADALRSYAVGYTPDSEQIEVLGVRVLKADGTERRLYETNDYGAQSGPASIYYDVHTRAVYVPGLEAGDVLMMEYTIEDIAYRNIFDDYFGDFWFAGAFVPRAFARYGVLMPEDRPLNTSVQNLGNASFNTENRGDEVLYVFEAEDIPAVERESYAPGAAELLPYVHVSTYGSWDALGAWYWNLIREQFTVSPEMRETVEELVDGVESRREIVSRIHEYVVRNTRYVGLEFGIHGFKPYRTTECFERRFGDCKDTASLIKVMLEEAGIDARIVLVRTRDLGRIEAAPPSLAVFNHAIAYVPEFDLYLDGTAGYSGSDELPTADQGATAVIIEDSDGGTPVEIPFLPAASNVTRSFTELRLERDGISGSYFYEAEGTYAPGIRRTFESEENRREALEAWFTSRVPGTEVRDVEVGELDDITESATLSFEFDGGEWGAVRAGEWRLPVLGRDEEWLAGYSRTSNRRLPLDLGVPERTEQGVSVRIPAGIEVISTPEHLQIQSTWGAFEMSVVVLELHNGQTQVETRVSLDLEGGLIAPEDYEEFREFALRIDRALKSEVRIALPEGSLTGGL